MEKRVSAKSELPASNPRAINFVFMVSSFLPAISNGTARTKRICLNLLGLVRRDLVRLQRCGGIGPIAEIVLM